VIQTSYTLGANTGFTFQQTYGTTTVSAHAVPDNGQRFVSNYVAMPVGNKMLMVTWYLVDGTITDVFVMNFQTGIVSDVAPHLDPPNGPGPPSLGKVKVLRKARVGFLLPSDSRRAAAVPHGAGRQQTRVVSCSAARCSDASSGLAPMSAPQNRSPSLRK
jgi:hypothetical protein